ncbi:hypothetical protein B0H15DRAFT_1018225, partial [Mycena belliarum]
MFWHYLTDTRFKASHGTSLSATPSISPHPSAVFNLPGVSHLPMTSPIIPFEYGADMYAPQFDEATAADGQGQYFILDSQYSATYPQWHIPTTDMGAHDFHPYSDVAALVDSGDLPSNTDLPELHPEVEALLALMPPDFDAKTSYLASDAGKSGRPLIPAGLDKPVPTDLDSCEDGLERLMCYMHMPQGASGDATPSSIGDPSSAALTDACSGDDVDLVPNYAYDYGAVEMSPREPQSSMDASAAYGAPTSSTGFLVPYTPYQSAAIPTSAPMATMPPAFVAPTPSYWTSAAQYPSPYMHADAYSPDPLMYGSPMMPPPFAAPTPSYWTFAAQYRAPYMHAGEYSPDSSVSGSCPPESLDPLRHYRRGGLTTPDSCLTSPEVAYTAMPRTMSASMPPVAGPSSRPYDLHDQSHAEIAAHRASGRDARKYKPMPTRPHKRGPPKPKRAECPLAGKISEVDVQTHYAAARSEAQDPAEVVCKWFGPTGVPCNTVWQKHNFAGHLKNVHGGGATGTVRCAWNGGCGHTGSLLGGSLRNHVRTGVHLNVGRLVCSGCKFVYCRSDALLRHLRGNDKTEES